MALLREQLAAFKVQPAAVLRGYPHGRLARASGLVTHRQRPETAKGVVFVTLEDETGSRQRHRLARRWPRRSARPLLAQHAAHGLRHLAARRRGARTWWRAQLVDHSALLQGLASASRNFR